MRLLAHLNLTTQLLLVLLVPIVGMTLFAGVLASGRLRDAREADADRARVDLLKDLSDLEMALLIDGRAVVITAHAAPEDRGVAAAGARSWGRSLDASADSVRRRLPLLRELAGPEAWPRIAEALARVPEARREILRSGGLPTLAAQMIAGARAMDEYERVGAVLDRTMAAVVSSRAGEGTSGLAASPLWNATRAVSLALPAADAVGMAAMTGRISPAVAAGLRSLVDRERLVLDLANRRSGGALSGALGRLRAFDDRVWTPLVERALATAGAASGEGFRAREDVRRVILVGQMRLSLLDAVRRESRDVLVAQAAASAHDARRAATIWLWVAGLLLLTSLALAAMMIHSSRPTLKALALRARRIEEGDLDLEPLGVHGRSETAALGSAFDGMAATITRRMRAHEALSRSIVETAAEAILTVSANGRIRTANAAAAEMTGRTPKELSGLPVTDVLTLSGRREVTNEQADLLRADGGATPVLLSTRLIEDERGEDLLTVFARDISERAELERRLEHAALHDGLTGLPNRANLLAQVERAQRSAVARGMGYALLFIDLDRFKSVNDALGHRVGDRLLVEVAERLRRLAEPSDTVARLAGDEFVVLAEETADVAAAEERGRELMRAFETPFATGSDSVAVSASIGVAWSDRAYEDPSHLLRNSDIAMYRAKQSGRGRMVLFDRRMQRWAEDRSEVERALARALASGGLGAEFQPIVDVESGRPVAVELLSRWQRDGVSIPPGVFIPIAEESGLIVDVGRAALRRGCEMLARWSGPGPGPNGDLRVAVNISGRHVTGGDLVGDVRRALAESGADPARLILEITESFLPFDGEEGRAELAALRSLGVALAIDDFGTGYSSLGSMRTLPADLLKVDRSFVGGISDDPLDRMIVRMVVGIGRELGVPIVAEGVETEDQLVELRRLGCDLAQGFLVARPMPIAALEVWLREAAVERGERLGLARD